MLILKDHTLRLTWLRDGSSRGWFTAGFAVALVLLDAGPAYAVTPELIPAVIGWQSTESHALAEAPLRLLDAPGGASVRTEWAPLYRDASGDRYEWARQEYEWRQTVRSATLGLAVLGEQISVRGEDPVWRVGSVAGGPPRVAFLWGERFGSMALAGAAGVGPGRHLGMSLAGSVERGPGWHAELAWSRWASRGNYEARYAESRFLGEAYWLDQRVECGLRGPTAAGDVELRLASLDHLAGDGSSLDVVEPQLGWRSVLVAWAPRGMPARARFRVEHGMGHSGFSASRDGVGFAAVGGGVWSDLASVLLRPERKHWTLRGWAGRWRSEPGGDLSTWPFVGSGMSCR